MKSTSWPTADTVGILLLNISYAKYLLLKAQSSSIDPPPLPKMITSTDFSLLKYLIPSIIESAAFSPWTLAGYKIISKDLFLLCITFIISLTAAPVLAVIIPILLGNFGKALLYFSSKIPSSLSSFFNLWNSSKSSPIPAFLIFSQ